MGKLFNIEKILNFILALGVCLVINLSSVVSNYQMPQYYIVIPVLFIYLIYLFMLKQKKINLNILLLIALPILSLIITAPGFGVSSNDFVSVFGFILIPVMVLIFVNSDIKSFIRYYVYIYSIVEIAAVFLLTLRGGLFNVYVVLKFREIFFTWPNAFSMMSAIKFGYTYILAKDNSKSRTNRILQLISVIVIFISLSRTGIAMLLIIYFSTNTLNYIKRNKSLSIKKLYNLSKVSIILILFIIVAFYAIAQKNTSWGATTQHTISERLWRWNDTFQVIKDNYLFGTGFRSTVRIVGEHIGSTHNDYLDLMLKSGIFIFTAIYGYFLARTLRLYKYGRYEEFSILLAIYASSFVQNPLKFISTMVLFSVILACSYKINKQSG